MRTNIIKVILTFKVFIFLLFMNFLIPAGFAQNNPEDYKIKIEFDKKINEELKAEDELIQKGVWKKKYVSEALEDIIVKWEKIIWTQLLPMYFENIKPNSPRRLPSCIIEAMNALLSNKEIKFKFTTMGDLSFEFPSESTGALRLSGKEDEEIPLGEYDPYKDKIIIYGVYKETYYRTKKDWEQGKGHCTASLLFHELIHQALRNAKNDKDLNEKFCVKIESTDEIDCFDPKTGEEYKYPAKRCTNKENMYDDEGIAEDCEMKAFSCGESSYKDYYNKNKKDKEKFKKFVKKYKPSGARAFNPDDEDNPSDTDDCSEELCKDGEECDDNCIKKEECPQKPPDHQDDNFSFSDGSTVNDYKLAPEALIYKGGFYHEAVNLFGGLLWDGENSAEELLKASKVLIIPSGAMYSHENDSTLKNILEEYVRRGGSIIILCQQYGIAYGPIGICELNRKKSNFFG